MASKATVSELRKECRKRKIPECTGSGYIKKNRLQTLLKSKKARGNFKDKKRTRPAPISTSAGIHVRGPMSITQFTSAQKNVYLFGEYHGYPVTCPDRVNQINVEDLFKVILNNNPDKIIDIFVEQDFISAKRGVYGLASTFYRSEQYLSRIFEKYRSCFREFSKNCPKNARLHYIDVRSFLKDRLLMSDIGYRPDKNTLPRTKLEIKTMGSFKDIMNNWKIQKQIDNIPSGPEKQALLNQVQTLEKEWSFLRKMKGKEEGIHFPGKSVLETRFFDFCADIVDLYTFARMTRSFAGGPDPNNIIFYGGDAHASRYRLLFTESGYKRVDATYSYTSCPNIGPFVPFFRKI